MGFSAVGADPISSCKARGLCGAVLPQMQLKCKGSESDASQCQQRVGADVFCSAEENVVLDCKGRRLEPLPFSALAAVAAASPPVVRLVLPPPRGKRQQRHAVFL
ncbi:unnamed protein product [Effrenium voratum]|uniref:Uncharacterized protein n=1 Tax=Effrenium voratum TaxID=2562239 RepID=A0AA36HML4_9DINO|nr:unnamed protein product [Effrenium voratum]